MRLSFLRIVWLLAFCAAGCTSDIIPATGEKRALGFTWEQEQEIGRQASKEIAAAFGIYDDPRLERLVERVGGRVLAESHLRRPGTDERVRATPITFRVLDSPSINAMAIPGGHIYVTRGLLAHSNNEDQLAVVLSHEIGHIAARHSARRAWQQQLGQGLLMGGALLGQIFKVPAADQLLNLGGTAAQLIFLRYSREDELESDRLSVEYSSLAGYDPRAAVDFFRTLSRIQEKEGQGLPNFLSTHPDPGDRLRRIQELAEERNIRGPIRTVDSSAYLSAIEGIVLGEDPRQGFVERNVFYHPQLGFRFPVPRGFRLVNQPAQVIMIEEQRRAIIGFGSSGEKSAQAAASRFASSGQMRVLESGKSQSDGLPAFYLIADAQADENQVVRLIGYWVEYRGRVYEFVAYTAPQAFGSFRSEFLRAMRGFGSLNDPQMLAKQPVRLRLDRAARTARFRDLIPARLPVEFRPEDLAIMNQVELDEEIPRGRILKFPAG